MKIDNILGMIDLGAMALPEFQRGYVWNREQVRGLMHSLYHQYPIGSLLVWATNVEGTNMRGDGAGPSGVIKLLLDGQQRMTTLYGIIRGRPPKFFEGRADAFTGLYFHLADETFEFYSPAKMANNPLWINVTDLMQKGIGEFISRLTAPDLMPQLDVYMHRLGTLLNIKNIDLHIDEVVGKDKTVDVVVEIFNAVNSGGTKLSKADLALAKICAAWPDARSAMRARLAKWSKAGYDFRLEWLLRVVNAIVTGEALFSKLADVESASVESGLQRAEKSVDTLLNLIAARLGLDHDAVLGSRYAFPVMARYLVQRGGHFSRAGERDKLLYWYVQTLLWGRYAGSTETALNQDLALIEQPDSALDRLIAQLRKSRGDLRIHPEDFAGSTMGARFYPLLYLLTRVWHAADWEDGVELRHFLLGKNSQLQVHHIFPKALLYKYGYARGDVNALANFTFLTQETNLIVSDRAPAEYLEHFAAKHPGAVESHWIPMDRDLWKVENYPAFLAARRALLAKAANGFLDSLVKGVVPEPPPQPSVFERSAVFVPGGIEGDDEERELQDVNDWVASQGLPRGEFLFQLTDPHSGAALAVLDLAWPDGLQEQRSEPVALLLNEGQQTATAANRAGFRYFTDTASFRAYVSDNILARQPAVV